MQEILLVAGLPGSGKTMYLSRLGRDGWSVFDDFKANARADSKEFRNAEKFDELIESLRRGLRCVVADIDFCDRNSRDEAESVLSKEVPESEICWCYFAHDADACRRNINRRNRSSQKSELMNLTKYSSLYSIPDGARVHPIWAMANEQ